MIETALISAIVLGLVEAVKRTNKISEIYLPLVAIVIGIIISGIATMGGTDFLFEGIIAGLSAVGLYEVSIDKLKNVL
jgi:hypothetical protein